MPICSGSTEIGIRGAGDKNAVCCCVMHLVLLYLDSLDVDERIASTVPRVSVWNSDLIAKVIKKDKRGRGEFGKLRLKTEFARCADESLCGSFEHVTKLVSARLPNSYDQNKQKKLIGMVHEMCSEISHSMSKFVQGIGKLDDVGGTTSERAADNVGGSRSQYSRKRQHVDVSGIPALPSDEESYKRESDTDEGDDIESEGSDGDEDDSDSDGDDGDGNMHGETTTGSHDVQDQEREDELLDGGGKEEDIGDGEVGREYDEQPGEDEVLREDDEEDEDEDDEEEDDDDENENEGDDNDGDDDKGGCGGNGYVGDQSIDRGHNAGTGNDGDKPGSDEAVNSSPESEENASGKSRPNFAYGSCQPRYQKERHCTRHPCARSCPCVRWFLSCLGS